MRNQLLRSTWNWLPAFLEVAECNSVVEASRNLGLTPAAVSRTLRLLEDHLGEQLFNRVGRSLTLNTRGAFLRDAARAAMAQVEHGLAESLGDPFAGPLRVSSLGVLTQHFVIPCLTDLFRENRGLQPEHLNINAMESNYLLARGELDIAFCYEQVPSANIVIEELGQSTSSIYCGNGHPLFHAEKLSRRTILDHGFSVPKVGETGKTRDSFPAGVSRKVSMQIMTLGSNVEVCLSGILLAVLPDITALPFVESNQMRRLPFRGLDPIRVYASRHESAPRRSAVSKLTEGITARIRSVNASVRKLHRTARRT